jgi:glycopeptide antibiotics resistance protein
LGLDVSKKRFAVATVLVLWIVLLICVIVFKRIPTVQIGHMRLRFGGSTHTGPANLVPFHTILPQLLGHNNRVMAKVNLLGNVLPFLPVGFLVPMIFRTMTWSTAIVLALGTGLLMEVLELVFRVGIFDVDDILLNAFGVCIGFACFRIFRK